MYGHLGNQDLDLFSMQHVAIYIVRMYRMPKQSVQTLLNTLQQPFPLAHKQLFHTSHCSLVRVIERHHALNKEAKGIWSGISNNALFS